MSKGSDNFVEMMTFSEFSTDFEGLLNLSDRLSVQSTCPVEVEPTWKEWLGKIRTCDIEDARLVFALNVAGKEDSDGELTSTESLRRALLLFGVPRCEKVQRLKFSRFVKVPEILEHSEPVKEWPLCGLPYWFVERDFKEAYSIAKRIEGITLRTGDNLYLRLYRVLYVYWKSLSESDNYFRIRGMVQALDGLFSTGNESGGRDRFKRCGRKIVTAHPDAGTVFSQAYKVRNNVEHLRNDIAAELPKCGLDKHFEGSDRLANRTRQIETLLRHSLLKILTSERLMGHFRDETSIDELWKKGDEEFSEIWEEPFNLTLCPSIELASYDRIPMEYWTII